MSAYAQVSDVRALAPQVPINASSSPSEGQVQAYLNEADAEIDAILANLGYTTPVAASATASRLILRDLAAHHALAKVLRARSIGIDPTVLESAREIAKYVDARLKALKTPDDPFELPDAEQSDRAVVKSPSEQSGSFVDEGFSDFDIDQPRVTRAQAW